MPSHDAVLNAVNQFKNHSSTTKIKKTIKSGETFVFQPVSSVKFRNEID